MSDPKKAFHFGIIGNFATTDEIRGGRQFFDGVPNGIVPNYIPSTNGSNSLLEIYPISHSKLNIPTIYDNVQIEPEVALECDVKYHNGSVLYINPRRFTAYNDASIHRLSSTKTSQNKNWGRDSKGIATKWFDIDRFDQNSSFGNYNLVSFIKRGSIIEQYSIDTPIANYNMLYQNLVEWIVKQIKTQRDSLALEQISNLIEESKQPDKFIINIGTTLYTSVGDRTFLRDGDEVFVVLYDRKKYRGDSIKAYLLAYKTRNINYDEMIILYQTAYLEEE
jgi:hypothetical protein